MLDSPPCKPFALLYGVLKFVQIVAFCWLQTTVNLSPPTTASRSSFKLTPIRDGVLPLHDFVRYRQRIFFGYVRIRTE